MLVPICWWAGESLKPWIRSTVLAFIPIAITGLIFGGYLVGALSITTSTTSITTGINYPTFVQSNETKNSGLGLELSLSLNSTLFAQGQEISINITEYNTLQSNNTLAREDNWSVSGLSLGPCSGNLPIGFEVFPGYYSTSNITQAPASQAIRLYQPGVYSCPALFFVNSYAFQPNSDIASIGYQCTPAPCYSPITISGSIAFNGSWSGGDENGGGAVHNPLGTGFYTVVGGDEWGQLILLHFVVTQINGPIKIGSVTFEIPWRYVGNVTLSGNESSCVVLRLPCPSNPQNSAEEFVSTNGTIAYAETAQICGPNVCTNYTIVLVDNNLYCVNPNSNIPSELDCPSILS